MKPLPFALFIARVLALLVLAPRSAHSAPVARLWTGGSASSGNWTAAANWSGNAPPNRGDYPVFAVNAARTTNTNNYPANTVFGGIIIEGDGYNIHGNPLTLTNHITVQPGALNNVLRPAIRLGGPLYIITRGVGRQLTLPGGIQLNGHALSFSSEGEIDCAGVISGTGSVSKSGRGRVVFSGIQGNTYSGSTLVYDGILQLSKYSLLNPGNFKRPRIAVPGDLVIGLGTSSLISDAVVCEASGQIGTNAIVTVRATGELNLNGNHNTIFVLRMSGGHVRTGDGILTVRGNVLCEEDEDGSVISGHLDLGPNGKFMIVSEGALLSVPAVVSGPLHSPLFKMGAGELRLNADNTYAGDTTVGDGTLRIITSGALGPAGGEVTLAGGRLSLVNCTIQDKPLTVSSPFSDRATLASAGTSNTWRGDVMLEGFVNLATAGGSRLTLDGRISGSGGFTKLGPGVLCLSGDVANTYAGFSAVDEGGLELCKGPDGSGGISISGSTLEIGDGVGGPGSDLVRYRKPGQVADGVIVDVQDSGRLLMDGWSDHVGALFGPGEVNLGDATLTVGGNGFSTTFWGVISGAGSLVKTGATTLRLSGTNTYTGATVVTEGTLLVNGQLNSNSIVEIRSGGTLGGTGRVHQVSVLAGGRLSPGASAGQLRVSDMHLQGGSLKIELNGAAPGIDFDQLTAVGAVRLEGSLDLSLGFTPAYGFPFVILNKTGQTPISGTFKELGEDAEFPAGGLLFHISYRGGDGNDVVLTRQAAPRASLTGLSLLSNGDQQVAGLGLPGLVYTLEAATDLAIPIHWTVLDTVQAGDDGQYQFNHPGPVVEPVRFFRVRSP